MEVLRTANSSQARKNVFPIKWLYWKYKVGVFNKVASEWMYKIGVSNKVASNMYTRCFGQK